MLLFILFKIYFKTRVIRKIILKVIFLNIILWNSAFAFYFKNINKNVKFEKFREKKSNSNLKKYVNKLFIFHRKNYRCFFGSREICEDHGFSKNQHATKGRNLLRSPRDQHGLRYRSRRSSVDRHRNQARRRSSLRRLQVPLNKVQRQEITNDDTTLQRIWLPFFIILTNFHILISSLLPE